MREKKLSDFIEEFHSALVAAGFNPINGVIKADDQWHPCLYGDERGTKCSGAYTIKIVDGDFAIGCYFTRKDPDKKFKWHSKSSVKMTSEERRARKKRMEEHEAEKMIELERKHKRLALMLTAAYKKLPKYNPEKWEHKYLERKGIQPHGIKYRHKGKELIIPIYGPDGRVFTVQRITQEGRKFLFTGGKKKGCYFPFTKKGEDFRLILICEGFATGATIRQATGLPVAAAIDSGNILHVLHTLKLKFPQSKFVICADNDAWTFQEGKRPKDIVAREIPADDARWLEWREAGMLWNVGIDKARQAAAKAGGASVVAPDFDGLSIADKPTDFNDLAALAGEEAVAKHIMAAVNAIPARGEAAEGTDATRDPDQHPLGGDYFPPNPEYLSPDYPPVETVEPIEIEEKGHFGLSFRCLGHYCGDYFYYSFRERRPMHLTASQHTIQNLLRLDTLSNWHNSPFGNKGDISDKKLALSAQNAMIQTCQQIGVFKEHDYIRGAGAWMDEGRIVINCGRKLFVDGVLVPSNLFKSEYCYVETVEMMRPYDVEPLTTSEAVMLRRVCEMVTWENKLSGSLLAGWLVIAPVCGALEYTKGMEYRPHIWLTGEHESGKSTVLGRIVRVILGRIGIRADGGYTEASIRQTMGCDARPLVYDEAEPTPTMLAIVDLARKATTGGIVGKFGQGESRIRFAACFSSINPPVSKSADESRISFLRIKKNRKSTAMDDYDKLSRLLDEHITDEFSRRLQARTIKHMKTLLKNILTFQRAARKVLGSARAGEQIGSMIAGLYLLHSTDLITDEAALEWIKKYNWNDHTTVENKSEPEKLLQHLCASLVRAQFGGIVKDISIGELIIEAGTKNSDEDKFLRRHGIAKMGNYVLFATKHENIKRLLRGTEWVDSYQSRLSELEGATKHNQTFYFSSGVRTSAISVPLEHFLNTIQPDLAFHKPAPETNYDNMEEVPLDD